MCSGRQVPRCGGKFGICGTGAGQPGLKSNKFSSLRAGVLPAPDGIQDDVVGNCHAPRGLSREHGTAGLVQPGFRPFLEESRRVQPFDSLFQEPARLLNEPRFKQHPRPVMPRHRTLHRHIKCVRLRHDPQRCRQVPPQVFNESSVVHRDESVHWQVRGQVRSRLQVSGGFGQ